MAKPQALKKLTETLKERGAIKPNTKKSKVSKPDRKPKASEAESINPYELKFTRVKHNVINRKVKGVNGNPSLSKKKSHEIVRV